MRVASQFVSEIIHLRIPVPFGYVPLTRPRPFSPLRQLSYHENAPLLGPTVDVEGWLRVKQETLKGTLFSERDIEMKCTVRTTVALF